MQTSPGGAQELLSFQALAGGRGCSNLSSLSTLCRVYSSCLLHGSAVIFFFYMFQLGESLLFYMFQLLKIEAWGYIGLS